MCLPVSIEEMLSSGVFFCKIFENKALSAYVEISGVVFPAQSFFFVRGRRGRESQNELNRKRIK